MIVLKICSSFIHTFLKLLLFNEIPRSKIFWNSIQSHQSCRYNSSISITIIRYLFVQIRLNWFYYALVSSTISSSLCIYIYLAQPDYIYPFLTFRLINLFGRGEHDIDQSIWHCGLHGFGPPAEKEYAWFDNCHWIFDGYFYICNLLQFLSY